MTELIRSPRRFLYWGSDVAKDGGEGGREGGTVGVQCRGRGKMEATGSKRLSQSLGWAENEDLGRYMLPTRGQEQVGSGGG